MDTHAFVARRPLTLAASVALGAVLLMGLAHASPMRPLLARLSRIAGSRGCPMSIANLSPDRIESQRARATATLGGEGAAKAFVAGPFFLAKTSRGDVEAWARGAGVACKEELAKTALRCADFPARALDQAAPSDAPAVSDALLRFDRGGAEARLAALDVMHGAAPAAVATSVATTLVARVERDAGPLSAQHGALDAAYLDERGSRMSEAQFRFAGYAADVSVFRLADAGPLVVREQYRVVGALSR